MKAMSIDGYGGSDRLKLGDMPDPVPAADEIVIRVRAAGVNPVDWKIRKGQMWPLVRLHFPYIPGADVAGEVLRVGSRVTKFKPGDQVIAFVDATRGGGYAELAAVSESAAAPKAASLTFAEAASLPIAAGAALQALRDSGGLKPDDKVLVLGGSGGVGHFAVQIAKALGAWVAATCSAANVDFVRSLGAELVIDYGKEDFTRRPERYDVILDAVAKSSFAECRPLLLPGGTYVTTVPGPDLLAWAGWGYLAGLLGPTRKARFILVSRRGEDLELLGRWADEGKLKPTISRVFPLDRAADAQEASQSGHTRGKIVLEL